MTWNAFKTHHDINLYLFGLPGTGIVFRTGEVSPDCMYSIRHPEPVAISAVWSWKKKQIENVLRKEIKQNSYLTLGEFIWVCQFSIQILEGITEALEIGLPVSLIVQSGGCDGHLRIVYDIWNKTLTERMCRLQQRRAGMTPSKADLRDSKLCSSCELFQLRRIWQQFQIKHFIVGDKWKKPLLEIVMTPLCCSMRGVSVVVRRDGQ